MTGTQVIYLVGQISEAAPITYEWRAKVVDLLYEEIKQGKFHVINPCDNEFNELARVKQGYKWEPTPSNETNLIVPKDYQSCQWATLAIADMNQYDPQKPLIGSFFELAWLYEKPGTAVLAVADDFDHYICQHPFVKQAVTSWFHTHDEACAAIKKFFVFE